MEAFGGRLVSCLPGDAAHEEEWRDQITQRRQLLGFCFSEKEDTLSVNVHPPVLSKLTKQAKKEASDSSQRKYRQGKRKIILIYEDDKVVFSFSFFTRSRTDTIRRGLVTFLFRFRFYSSCAMTDGEAKLKQNKSNCWQKYRNKE